MYAVYSLKDPRDGLVFYVGITDDVYTRFLTHLKCDGSNPLKDAKITEIKNANRMVIMEILQDVDGLEQAKKREAYWIRHFYDLGMPLTNLVMPIHHDNVIIVQSAPTEEPKPRLKAKMTLEEQKAYIVYLLNTGTPRRSIFSRIDGYIHSDIVRETIEECMVRPEKPSSMAKYSVQKNQGATGEVTSARGELTEEWRSRILAKLAQGKNRTRIQQELGLSGDQYWMVKAVCDREDRQRHA